MTYFSHVINVLRLRGPGGHDGFRRSGWRRRLVLGIESIDGGKTLHPVLLCIWPSKHVSDYAPTSDDLLADDWVEAQL